MKVLGKELGGGVDSSAEEFRDDLILKLSKCIEEPFAMNSFSERLQFGQQQALKEIIEYLKWII
jgi:hypothetical protein